MFISLRIIRAFFGLLAGSAFLSIVLFFINRIPGIPPTQYSQTLDLIRELPVLIICGILYVAIRKLIHYLHNEKFGIEHPKLGKLWNL